MKPSKQTVKKGDSVSVVSSHFDGTQPGKVLEVFAEAKDGRPQRVHIEINADPEKCRGFCDSLAQSGRGNVLRDVPVFEPLAADARADAFKTHPFVIELGSAPALRAPVSPPKANAD